MKNKYYIISFKVRKFVCSIGINRCLFKVKCFCLGLREVIKLGGLNWRMLYWLGDNMIFINTLKYKNGSFLEN